MAKAASRNEQEAASLVDRIAIVKNKGYRDRVDFLFDSFLDCLPRGGRILPRRALMRTMKMAKAENAEAELKVWCESCCIRVAPNEERIVVRGKTYHSHCYSKLNSKPKVDVPGVPE